jgi:hypothetical protein
MFKMKKKQKEQFKSWAIVILLLLLFVSVVAAFKGDDNIAREILRDYAEKEQAIYNPAE